MKKAGLALLALLMAFSLILPGCGNNANNNAAASTTQPPKTEAAKTEAEKTEAAKTEEVKTEAAKAETTTEKPKATESATTEPAASGGERKTLTFGAVNFIFNTANNNNWPTDFYMYMCDRINADIEFLDFDIEKTNLVLASGDLPDIFMCDKPQQVLDGKLAVALDDYLDEYGQYIKDYPIRNTFMRRYLSNGDGKLYFHTPNSGGEDITGGTEIWNGYLVRWDLYKKLGAPEMKNDDDYIEVMRQMKELYPQTEEGLPVYAMGVHNDWGLWGWCMRAISNNGFSNVGPWAYITSTQADANIHQNYIEEDSPFYENMRFYNTLNKEGLLDPDSFIMTSEEVGEKAGKKQYLGGYCTWFTGGLYAEARKLDPNTLEGIMAVPAEGQNGWYGQDAKIGWAGKYMFVTSRAKDIPLGVSFINMMDDPEVNRTHYSGIQGKHWDYVDGKPRLFDDVIAMRAENGDPWKKTGINSFANFIGASGFGTATDGSFFTLWDDLEIKKASLSPLQKDFSAFYGVEYPAQLHYNMVKNGKAINQNAALHTTINAGIGAVPSDISRIDSKLDEIASKAIPLFVNAANEAEFNAVKDKFLSDLKTAGCEESWKWWQTSWNEARAYTMEMYGIK